ncbi:YafY family protein [Pseudovibrio sp. SPO723]|uniref:helix-turn-helix transcriptional regulator n=1 Tax=Nesiotobacter zosterae TaxID=392721 RepID=UPI0029C1617D|nr:YafY family protein [Pseudovibrio sp. SPO723]MDX5592979.1 YafY family protein [Pseudovibrio sp. SPO723]
MRKVDRLFEIIQLLRGQRLRTAEFIAGELGVSVRTVYRDIQALIASGIPIEGARGVGYLIQQPIELPPLHFTALELKAIQLGLDMARAAADAEIAKAAQEAAIKVADALPSSSGQRQLPQAGSVYFLTAEETKATLLLLRNAIERKECIEVTYSDAAGGLTQRRIRPLGLEYWGSVWTVTAWCELRDDFRVFRADRIMNSTETGEVFRDEKGKTYRDYTALMEARLHAR